MIKVKTVREEDLNRYAIYIEGKKNSRCFFITDNMYSSPELMCRALDHVMNSYIKDMLEKDDV